MRYQLIVVLAILFTSNLEAQFIVREVDSVGIVTKLDKDSLLKIPQAKIDSIVLMNLEIPKELDNEEVCEGCMGTIYYEFRCKNKEVIEVNLLRGIDDYIDSIFLKQHQKVFEIVKSIVEIDSSKLYSLVIPIRLERAYSPDSIYLSDTSINQKIDVYTIRKNVFTFSYNQINFKKGYKPKDLDDCIEYLDLIFDEPTKAWIREHSVGEFSNRAHMGLGRWMRNSWGLWAGSQLSKYFNGIGIYHPDDMSGIIINSYYRYLNSQEIKLEEQIKHYQEYWEKVNTK